MSRKNVLHMIALASLLALFYQLHQFNKDFTRFQLTAPKRTSCERKINIAFLKTHKCASSTIQNLLMRYGERHSLTLAIPNEGNYFGYEPAVLTAKQVKAQSVSGLDFNIFAMHSKWNMTEMVSMMPKDTVFVTIVREPSSQFKSLFSYTNYENQGKNLSQFIKTSDVNHDRLLGFVGLNQQTFDLGLPANHFNKNDEIDSLISQADSTFHLVMVAERMEESLVLLSHALCVPLSEVAVIKINARKNSTQSDDESLDNEDEELLRDKLQPDYKLYDHFYRKFDQLVQHYGKEKMKNEVDRLKYITNDLKNECQFVLVENNNRNVDMWKSATNNSDCNSMVMAELQHIEKFRQELKKELKKI